MVFLPSDVNLKDNTPASKLEKFIIMPIDQSQLFSSINFPFVVKAILILLLIFNLIFSLLVFRQTQLMGKRLPTPLVPLLKFAATIYIGLSVAVLFLVIGVF